MSYLDTQFPSFASVLANIDNESARLNASSETLESEQTRDREAATQQAQQIASRLKTALTALPMKLDEVSEIVESLDVQKKKQVLPQVSKIQELLEFRKTLETVDRLLTIGAAASSRLADGKLTDAAKEYEKVHPLMDELRRITEPSRSRTLSLQTLAEFKESVTQPLMTALQDRLAEELGKSQWPKKEPESLEFFEALSNALRVEDASEAVLESFVELAAPLDLRVKFNFETERETNRADKPEWLLGHFFKMVDPHIRWLTTTVQPVLEERFSDRLALVELCSALLPSYYRVLQSYFEHVKYTPELLNHLMSEIIHFDVDLHDRYFYRPAVSSEERWGGLAASLLKFHPDWFDLWLESERQAALAQYNEILAAPTAWEIDWDGANETFTHPTVSAINITQLFDSVTDIYRDLQNPTYQLRMLAEIQLELVENYRRLLTERVALYSTVNSSLGRAVGSVSAEDQKRLQGTSGLHYLGRTLGSCSYVLNFLLDKANELLFFRMAERVGESSIFELNTQEFESVKERNIKEIVRCLSAELQKLIKPYYHQEWRFESESVLDVSSQLNSIIAGMKLMVDFIEKLAGRADFGLIMNKFTTYAAKQIFQHVVQANSFSPAGGLQLLKDVETLWLELKLTQGHDAQRLQQAAKLLSDNAVETPAFDDQERAFILKRSLK